MPPLRVLTLLLLASVAGAGPRTDQYGDPLPPGAIQRLGRVRPMANYADPVRFTPDGKAVVVLNAGIHFSVFDRASGRLLEARTLPTSPVLFADLFPDARRAVLCRSEFEGRKSRWEVWDLTTGREVWAADFPGRYPGRPHISPTGRYLVKAEKVPGPADKVVMRLRAWDLTTGRAIESDPVGLPGDGPLDDQFELVFPPARTR